MSTLAYYIPIFWMDADWSRITIMFTTIFNAIEHCPIITPIAQRSRCTWLNLIVAWYFNHQYLVYVINCLRDKKKFTNWSLRWIRAWIRTSACCLRTPIFYPFRTPFWPIFPCIPWIFRTWDTTNVSQPCWILITNVSSNLYIYLHIYLCRALCTNGILKL